MPEERGKMTTNRDTARAALREANQQAGNAEAGDYPSVMALTGIGCAMLDVADAIRDIAALLIKE